MRKPKKNLAGYSGPGSGIPQIKAKRRSNLQHFRAINNAIRDLNKIQADLEKISEIEIRVMQEVIAHAIANIEGAIEYLCTEGVEPE